MCDIKTYYIVLSCMYYCLYSVIYLRGRTIFICVLFTGLDSLRFSNAVILSCANSISSDRRNNCNISLLFCSIKICICSFIIAFKLKVGSKSFIVRGGGNVCQELVYKINLSFTGDFTRDSRMQYSTVSGTHTFLYFK